MTAEDKLRQGLKEDIIRSVFSDPEMQNLGRCPGLNLRVAKQHAERLVKAAENAKAAKRKKGEDPNTADPQVLKDGVKAISILQRLKMGGIT
jgi:hypothetical protein